VKLNRVIPGTIAMFMLFFFTTGCEALTGSSDQGIEASGVVEAVEVTISAEISGRVAVVMVEEGDPVRSGQTLFKFRNTQLEAQLDQAQAAVAQAQANYDLISAQPLEEQRQAEIAAAQLELTAARQDLQSLIEDADLAKAAASQTLADARDIVRDAERRVANLKSPAKQTDIDQAKANVILLRDQLEEAREDFEPYAGKPEDNLTRATYLSRLAQVQEAYNQAVRRLNNLLGEANEIDLAQAEAELEMAEASFAEAQREYEKLQDGLDPDKLTLAEARLEQAEANLALSQAETRTEQLALAQTQIAAARAELSMIQSQIEKLTVSAPVDGTVLLRIVQTGELIQPGATALTIGQLERLTVTVYIPEDRYGQVKLGDQAQVRADSFPGETFNAEVIRVAEQAEYTPRNVQTEEERSTTVFAVELSLEDPSGKLKPGMPVDVQFES
jgi:HlyD family secretion protein